MQPDQKEKRRAYNREWRRKNPEKVKAHDRKKYLRARERLLAKAKAMYPANAEYIKANRRERYWADPVKARAKNCTDEVRRRKNARRLAWSNANREKQTAANWKAHLRRYHGLTVEQYQARVEAQKGLCAICGLAPSGKGRAAKLHVDHDHASTFLRDLLCHTCNKGLGCFKDDPRFLTRAAWYLERHRLAHRGRTA